MALSSSTIIGVGILAGVATLVLMPEICIAGIAIGPEVSAAIVAGLVKIASPEHHYQPEDKAEAVAEVAETVFEEVIDHHQRFFLRFCQTTITRRRRQECASRCTAQYRPAERRQAFLSISPAAPAITVTSGHVASPISAGSVSNR